MAREGEARLDVAQSRQRKCQAGAPDGRHPPLRVFVLGDLDRRRLSRATGRRATGSGRSRARRAAGGRAPVRCPAAGQASAAWVGERGGTARGPFQRAMLSARCGRRCRARTGRRPGGLRFPLQIGNGMPLQCPLHQVRFVEHAAGGDRTLQRSGDGLRRIGPLRRRDHGPGGRMGSPPGRRTSWSIAIAAVDKRSEAAVWFGAGKGDKVTPADGARMRPPTMVSRAGVGKWVCSRAADCRACESSDDTGLDGLRWCERLQGRERARRDIPRLQRRSSMPRVWTLIIAASPGRDRSRLASATGDTQPRACARFSHGRDSRRAGASRAR